MRRPLATVALIAAVALFFGPIALSESNERTLIGPYTNSDEPSGWKRIEIAIFVDADSQATASEVWPRDPGVAYPTQRRWLVNYEEIRALTDRWGEDAVTLHSDGFVEIIPEIVPGITPKIAPEIDPAVVSTAGRHSDPGMALETGDELAPARITDSLERSDKPMSERMVATIDNRTDQGTIASPNVRTTPIAIDSLFEDADAERQSSNPPPIEGLMANPSLQTAESGDDSDNAMMAQVSKNQRRIDIPSTNFFAIEGLGNDADNANIGASNDLFGTTNPARGLSNDGLDASPDDRDADDFIRETSAPNLPESYQTIALELLVDGLAQLRKKTKRHPVLTQAWLQPPGVEGTPVIIDSWTGDSGFAQVQGTVRIGGGEESRLEVNVWANTDGAYLPKNVKPLAVPPAPVRVSIIEVALMESANQSAFGSPSQQNGESSTLDSTDERPRLPVTAAAPTIAILQSSVAASSDESTHARHTPFKHAISLNERRELREGHVRYIDHPVIQVAATWQELTYAEVYELGEAQRLRRDIDELTRALTVPDTPSRRRAPAADSPPNRSVPPASESSALETPLLPDDLPR